MTFNKNYVKYISSLLIFGSNGILASFIALSSNQIVMMRTFIGSLIMIALFLLTKNHFTFYKSVKDTIFMAISGFATGISWIFLYQAYNLLGVSIASLTYYTGPVIVMVLSPLVFKEKLHFTKIASFIIVLLGLFLLTSQAATKGATPYGLFCGAMSAIMYAVMIIFNKKAEHINGMEKSIMQIVFSCIIVSIYTLLVEKINLNIGLSSWAALLTLGILNTAIGCYLYFATIGSLPVQSVSILGYLEPLSAVIMSVIILRESMSLFQIIGALCIIMGALVSELRMGTMIQKLHIKKESKIKESA